MATDAEGMSLGTKTLLTIGVLAAVAYGLPKLLDAAASNPRALRSVARATRSTRDRALAATGRGARRAGRYLASKF